MPTTEPNVFTLSDGAAESIAEFDRRLASRIQMGDGDALGELYDRYAALALGVALRVVHDPDAAEDIVHDAFLAVWRKIGGFDATRGSVRSWLLAIVRNRGIDRLRAQRPTIEVGEADEQALLRTDADPTLAAAIEQMSNAQLREALDVLPDEQRQAIELAYFQGHTYRQIAEITGVPQGTANGRLRLALQKLRALLIAADPWLAGRGEAGRATDG